MSSDQFDVARVVPTELVTDGEVPLTAVFRYTATDPLAVSVLFRAGEMQIEWTFARDLLEEGLSFAAGIGDVLIGPESGTRIQMILRSPEGSAKMLCDRDALQQFLDQTHDVIPAGQESLNLAIDELVASLGA